MYKYDFGLSFAGEDREHAKKLADLLKAEDVRVFYDHNEEATLWGQDLYQKFQQIYGRECRFFIPIVSANYVAKRWPKHELKQAQARDFKSDVEYILPLRLDDTELPGLNDTTAYVDLRKKLIEDVVQFCLTKLIRDAPIRRFYMFLRESNPGSISVLAARPQNIVLRVATSKARILAMLLSQIDSKVCHGVDQHNMYANGGLGPPGVVASLDPEPHTTFSLTLSEAFYVEIPA